ncbi:hypothetical protein ACP275_14G321600 [Erythranthe tilingii]
MAKKRTDVIFLKIDANELKFLARDYTIEDVPTFVFLKQGKEVDRCVAPVINHLRRKIDRLAW